MTERFEVGQKVRHGTYGDGEITYGPYNCVWGSDAYLARREDGKETTWFGRSLSAIPEPAKFAAGDKARGTSSGIVYTVEAGPIEGSNGVWYVTRKPNGDVCINSDRHLERIDEPADTYEHDGVTYDLSARYRDNDGDVWRFERRPDGVVRGNFTLSGRNPEVYDHSDTLAQAVRGFGPLTRVND